MAALHQFVAVAWVFPFGKAAIHSVINDEQTGPHAQLGAREPHLSKQRTHGRHPLLISFDNELGQLRPFGDGYWVKLDAKIPYEWEDDEIPANAELQLGYNLSPSRAVYAEGLLGVGGDRSYDAGAGLGLRFKF